jgi:hypothetical protein
VPSNRLNLPVSPDRQQSQNNVTVPIAKSWISYIFLVVPTLFDGARLASRFLGRNSFGDTEGHLDSTGTIVNVRFDVAIQAERDCSAAELDSGAKPYCALPGIAHVAAVDVVVGQLLQPVPVKAKPYVLPQFEGSRVVDVKSMPWLHASNSELYEWVVVGGIPEIVEARAKLYFLALMAA